MIARAWRNTTQQRAADGAALNATVLVLHGTWVPEQDRAGGEFFLWAERVPASRRGRRPSGTPRDGAPHPYQARPEEVRDALIVLSPLLARGVDQAVWRLARACIRLPSGTTNPLRSPEAARLVAARQEETDAGPAPLRLTLGIWQVRGLTLELGRAAPLLASLPGDGRLPSGSMVLGSDIRYWSAAAKLVLELLARQRLVPALERDGGAFEARWRPVLDDARDASRIDALIRGQPPVARALVASPRRDPVTPRRLLESFIESAIDALAREWVKADGGRRSVNGHGAYGASRAWVEALGRGERAVRASALELEQLASRLAEWRAPLVTASTGSPYRLCFRLEEPRLPETGGAIAGDGALTMAPWTLRLFLQASDEPELLLPAEEVWRVSGDALIYHNRRFDQPQERLLAELARAARCFPPLDRCLGEARPSSCLLSAEEAYHFLREAAWLLEEHGFGVLLPRWWDHRGPRGRIGLRLRARPTEAGGRGVLGRQAVVEYDWRLAVGDVELSEAEFRQLAALKVPLVCVRGQWVEVRPDKVEQAVTFWEKQRQTGQAAPGAVLSLALSGEEVEGLPVLGVQAEGWLQRLIEPEAQPAAVTPVPAPEGFVGQLRAYQERGVGWLRFMANCGLGACLADDMGLGKTVQYIAFLLQRQADGLARRPALLICPTSVIGNWRHELERFAPRLRVLVHHGPARATGAEFLAAAREHDLVITSYALVYRDRETLAAVEWDGIVLDEAQNIKNPATLQARAVRDLTGQYRFALTGTPIENHLTELWSIVDFLNPGYLGSQHRFRERFVTPIERWQDPERSDQLRRLVRPLILRRVKTDPAIIQDLPEKLEMKTFCTLTTEQASLYQAVVSEMLRRIEQSDGIQRRGLVLATLTRLKQVCNHPAQFLGDGSPLPGRSGKLERLREMLEEVLAAGDRALIFTQFVELGARLQEYLRGCFGCEVLFLHGGVPAEQRDAMVARFQQESDGPPIFILSLRAGGVGLNLTRASHVFHFDRWWNPAVENQATDRAFRIGQQQTVQVHKLICVGTLEERIDQLIESKKALAEQIIGTGEGWLTELSVEELRDVLTLRSSAVVE